MLGSCHQKRYVHAGVLHNACGVHSLHLFHDVLERMDILTLILSGEFLSIVVE